MSTEEKDIGLKKKWDSPAPLLFIKIVPSSRETVVSRPPSSVKMGVYQEMHKFVPKTPLSRHLEFSPVDPSNSLAAYLLSPVVTHRNILVAHFVDSLCPYAQ